LKAPTGKKIIVLKKKQTEIKTTDDGLVRLNKYISNAGICSRRDADKLISEGLVKVNGEVVTELGRKVSLDDDIQFDGNRLNPEKKVYLLLNKPRGFATTVDDPHVERTVMQLIQNACPERVYSAVCWPQPSSGRQPYLT